VDAALWVGVVLPAGTPATIVDKLDREVVRLLGDETIKKRLNELGTDPSPLSQQAFVERIQKDASRYKAVAEQAGIAIER
jgi:tripartite-type tricarboxylate transporter receptor subunit TctC